ncbi:US12 family protein [candidate division KSB1 bacterium]|nr:US12 family protein [candidate division KSB1 bacterium]
MVSYYKRNYSIKNRPQFIARVYVLLCLAVILLVIFEVLLFRTGIAQPMARRMLGVSWLLILGGFVLIGWFARRIIYRVKSRFAQYAALLLYIIAKTIILAPLLYLADNNAPGAIRYAAQFTIISFIGLTWIVYATRKDFSFLRGFLVWGGLIAFILIISAIALNFSLGVLFSIGMITLAGASILYDTSRILGYYSDDRYVAAATALFASVALLFWYALRIFRRLGQR